MSPPAPGSTPPLAPSRASLHSRFLSTALAPVVARVLAASSSQLPQVHILQAIHPAPSDAVLYSGASVPSRLAVPGPQLVLSHGGYVARTQSALSGGTPLPNPFAIKSGSSTFSDYYVQVASCNPAHMQEPDTPALAPPRVSLTLFGIRRRS